MGQKETMVTKLFQLQNKAMRITTFKTNDHPADALYHGLSFLVVYL